MTGTEELIRWTWSLKPDDVPFEVRHAATRHLLDGIGNAIAGARTGAGGLAVDVATQFSSPAEATVIGDGRRIPAPMAALANGTLINALDFDDTHAGGLVHPTATILPAAFEVGEQTRASGSEVLLACIAGYEVVARLGAVAPHGFHARGLHATSVCGVFAASLVAARLDGLNEDKATNALGIAGSTASGLLEFLNTGSATKQFHPGWAAMSGVMAARLAASGASGPATVLEESYGLYRALAGVEVESSAITTGLGTRWETTAITIKPYPACQLSHATLDALLAVRAELAGPGEVEKIICAIPDESVPIIFEPIRNKVAPRTEYEAKFSLPWSVALLIDGELGIDSFAPDRLTRPDVVDLASKVFYNSWDPGVPAAAASAKSRSTCGTGACYTARSQRVAVVREHQ